jgi:hypothetical protein
MNLTPQELRMIRHAVLATYEEPRSELLAKLDAEISAQAVGQLVFRLELALWSTVATARRQKRRGDEMPAPPRLWAPTMNEYKGIASFEVTKLKKAIDEAILRTKALYPRWGCGVTENARLERGKPVVRRHGGRPRLVVVERESNRPPDELSADAIGGKVPIDRLVAACILRDDNREWCLRYAKWTPVPRGAGRVIVSVYELLEK